MNLISQKNRWSCTACSFAMGFDIDINELYNLVGHDGSEIIFPDLPEPKCRRSFHPQEFFWVGLKLGYLVVQVEMVPLLSPDNKIEWPVPMKVDDFLRLTCGHVGVFTGYGRSCRHAVAWDGHNIHDPNGLIYDFGNPYFTPDTFYMILKSNEKFC